MNQLFIFMLSIALLSGPTPVKAANDVTELEKLVTTSEKLAVIAKECTDSQDTKSSSCRNFINEFNKGNANQQIKVFGANLSQYLKLDKELTFKALTATSTISAALAFVLEETNQNL